MVIPYTLTTMRGKINYAKGVAFEQRFSIYMMTELGYDKIRRRQAMTGSESIKGSEADIVGVILDPRGKKFKIAAKFCLAVCCLILIAVISELIPVESFIFYAVIIVFGIIYADISKKLVDKYTWVECKCRKTTSDIRIVRDFYNAVQDYNNSKDKKYSISKMIFVSASGFVDNALQYASEKGIECYCLSENKFQKVEY